MTKLIRGLVGVVAAGLWILPAASEELKAPASAAAIKIPLGLQPIPWPKDNPYSPEKWDLGRALYYDTRLSADNTVSCASCHSPKMGFTDQSPNSAGIRGQRGDRSAPTVLNRAYALAQFWDGRAKSLEEQAVGPIANPIEMGNTHPDVVGKLKSIPGYRAMFKAAFGTEDFAISHVGAAIATFERTVLSGNSPYDQYKAGKKKALNASQVRGLDVFVNKAKCDQCHEGINFTLNAYHNLGVGTTQSNPDGGRHKFSGRDEDWGAFKTPTLRDIANTAPYMHDGSLKTLEEVVEYYDKGGTPNKNLDERIKPLKLTAQDKTDLVAFMKSLSGEGWQQMTAPQQFPQ